jgi:sugar phosphate isomerase/epimerase
MPFVYFTKTLQKLDVPALAAFCKEVGLDGVDMAVRPGFPVTPDNVGTALPEAAKVLRDQGLTIGLVTFPTSLNDAESKAAKAIFEACGKANIPAIKIGYFPYKDHFEDALKSARVRLAGFAKLAEQTKVRACCHTHSGNYIGNNAASLRLLLQDLDPHHVGAFLDTGHTAVNGGPIKLEVDILRPWLSMIAIKDMVWKKDDKGWHSEVAPVGDGIVKWNDFAQAMKDARFTGTISLHGEYEAKDLAERKELAKRELGTLKKLLS